MINFPYPQITSSIHFLFSFLFLARHITVLRDSCSYRQDNHVNVGEISQVLVDMYKNQLQELAQRSCFNLPSYACIREGPDHAPRFKASVNFNGDIFESPSYCTTLRQAEHAAAEVALNVLSTRGPSRSLTARVLDETGIYKNLLQETAHRAGLNLPVYTTVRSGPGHIPTFTCTVELAEMSFNGEPAKTKKQAEKNAAISAWSALKRMPNLEPLTKKEAAEAQEQVRRKYHNLGRRMVKGPHRVTSSSNSLQHPQWRLMDLVIDSPTDGSSSQKHKSFVSLLPPPPPRTTSKILPSPSVSHRHIPVHIRSNSQEHQKDGEEWICGQPDSKINSMGKEGPINITNSSVIQGSSSRNRPLPLFTTGKLGTSSPMARSVYTGGFNVPYRMAPAVTVRSVIPVCAAPPPATKSSIKENTTSNSPSISSMFNKPEPEPEPEPATLTNPIPNLSSELNKLRL
ncbi:double-stranded RNA-binding protein 3-like [Tripterygium wilfordii]|uniref:double-stranded RNA-binding protein 3-like n=1 Tax=Tripterygium wilfordii TaxID=458696 RepID=UPI0018F85D88|nr:double-stranded RNA-binding protein 3-like [Tripterygium wilfordii]